MAVYRGPSAKWLFTREQLDNTPSRRCGIEADRELSYRQQAANLIQDIGQRLNVSQLIINTAIVYMHRFYMLHSFNKFHRNVISQVTLFLASKVEEQPRKLELVIKIAHAIINPQEPALDTKSNAFQLQLHEFVVLEAIVLQTLGFDITIDHPHTDVVKCCQLVRASKDLAQTSYFMATNR
ncbi:cyclin-T2-like isoform X2 [Gouania willdenowi]|uniref:cyclin-T2-like isoform X2 n=1 Tax=Gouania willdenowi TaxID=441366 RepID=UPI0010568727|nr:cyclin-T2-like isoform X2 [Gouania willdenowi]